MRKVFQWIKDNPNRTMFLVPILLVAGISISHVVSWYDIANPINWAIYLSIAIEVGAMTALVAATNKIKGGVWFMFGLVTLIQMIGNIFFSYKEIDANGDLFKSWVELTSPLWEIMGSDPNDIASQKRWLAFLEGGLLPIISLTSLHFFTKYDGGKKEVVNEPTPDSPIISGPSEEISEEDYETIKEEFLRKKLDEEVKLKYKPTQDDFNKLDNFLKSINYDGPKPEQSKADKYSPSEDDLKKMEQEGQTNFGSSCCEGIKEREIMTEPSRGVRIKRWLCVYILHFFEIFLCKLCSQFEALDQILGFLRHFTSTGAGLHNLQISRQPCLALLQIFLRPHVVAHLLCRRNRRGVAPLVAPLNFGRGKGSCCGACAAFKSPTFDFEVCDGFFVLIQRHFLLPRPVAHILCNRRRPTLGVAPLKFGPFRISRSTKIHTDIVLGRIPHRAHASCQGVHAVAACFFKFCHPAGDS
jgi:hypothetical protein